MASTKRPAPITERVRAKYRDTFFTEFINSELYRKELAAARAHAVEHYKVSDDNAARQAARDKTMAEQAERMTSHAAAAKAAEEAKRAKADATEAMRAEMLGILATVAKDETAADEVRAHAAQSYLEQTDPGFRMGPFGPIRLRG